MRSASTLLLSTTLITLSSLAVAPPVQAQPYPMCSPTVDPDCYFLYAIHQKYPRITNDDSDLIGGAKEACSWMREANSATAFGDWIVAFGREHPQYNAPGEDVSGFGMDFAMYAATAFCPNMLNKKNPTHW
jgi:hypothetical protein